MSRVRKGAYWSLTIRADLEGMLVGCLNQIVYVLHILVFPEERSKCVPAFGESVTGRTLAMSEIGWEDQIEELGKAFLFTYE